MSDHDAQGSLSSTPSPSAKIPASSDNGSTKPSFTPRSTGKQKPESAAHKDSLREIAETIVFVVVLVLLLKTFAAEAFVIPTGSMAETLWGYQRQVSCPQCDYKFPVNCSDEVEKKPPEHVRHCTCPNCRYSIDFKREGMPETSKVCSTGDRVLVFKSIYDTRLMDLKPFDVVVFKFPEEPQVNYVPMNYIKRLIGLPGQTIGIHYGDIYVAEGDPGQGESEAVDEGRLPIRRRMHRDQARDLLESGSPVFQILRKPPDKIEALSRIVYDNDHQAADLKTAGFPPRWAAEVNTPDSDDDMDRPAYLKKRQLGAEANAWHPDEAHHGFTHKPGSSQGEIAWLRYRHVLRDTDRKPRLITDFLGYNTGKFDTQPNWVSDLILECAVKVEKAMEGDELILELSRGADRFQARVQLATGACSMARIQKGGETQEFPEKASTKMKKPGTYHLRIANVDRRLTLWIDGDLVFGDGLSYEPAKDAQTGKYLHGPTRNDLEPASIGVKGATLSVHKLKLWRDTYYTYQHPTRSAGHVPDDAWNSPARWKDYDLDDLPGMTLYVQPGHYLCLGDNSPQSSDSRSWGVRSMRTNDTLGGLVPESLLLGRALVVYYPLFGGRAGPIK